MDSHRNDICWSSKFDRQRQKQELNSHIRWVNREKQVAQERHQKVLYYRQVKKETAEGQQGTAPPRYAIQALYRQSES